jgi:hypothetical protein
MTPTQSSKRFLEPIERVSEVLFGLIMVLTFTGSLSVAEAGRADVHAMLIGALGCNIAWGIIDGILYLMGTLNEQGRGIRAWRALRNAGTPEAGYQVIANALPPIIAGVLGPNELEPIRGRLIPLPDPPLRPRLTRPDWLGALAVFTWVFVTTLPVTLPFIFMRDIMSAMRTSNVIAIVLLFLTGYAFGRCAEYRPGLTGLAMVALGSALVAVTILLGG